MEKQNRREFLGQSLLLAAGAAGWSSAAGAQDTGQLPAEDGYRGIWYYNQPSKDEYVYKYSGGFATYPQQHLPIAYYAKEVNKTFFCFGGTVKGKRELLHLISYYDHHTGMVPKPRVLLNKKTEDAHDNPTLMLDDDGYLWIFSNSHGTARPSYIHRSKQPYSINAFERVATTNFSYGQPWHLPGKGFLFLHTRYASGRALRWMTSADGRQWDEPRLLAKIAQGHYQISWRNGTRLATAFNYHPPRGGLNARTNLYYAETRDHAASWRAIDGKALETPLTQVHNPTLVRDYEREGLLVYLKDLQFDAQGHPVILYLTTKGYESGPKNDPRMYRTARWTGREWDFRDVCRTDHNYDFGSLYIEDGGLWRMIGVTEPGPQPYSTGGELAMWTSRDQGRSWNRERLLTRNSPLNHTYPRRPVNAHPDFYALWADGHAFQPSESSLYFCNRAGDRVCRLPVSMKAEFEKPEPL